MLIAPQELPARLSTALPSVILLHGDEPLLVEESTDCVRAAAIRLGFDERVLLVVEPGFDWLRIGESARSLSLFSSRRLLELRLATGRPGDAGTRAITAYCAESPGDTALLIVCGRLDAASKQTAWFKTVAQHGIVVEHRAVTPAQLPAWIRARVRARGLTVEAEAVERLAYYLEGNLLAAAQQIDQLALLSGGGAVDARTVAACIADHARFNVYAFADACLAGDAAKAVRILTGLRSEGTEPALLVWALAREVRKLARIAQALAQGQPRAQVFKAHQVWAVRAPVVNAALRRLARRDWLDALAAMAALDRVLKGRQSGNIWLALERAGLALCGVETVASSECKQVS